MDIHVFVQNVKHQLDMRGISYSRAGRESGAGEDFIRNIDRKSSFPSIDKVKKMADYLGVTVGELLGERPPEVPPFPEHPDLVLRYDQLSEEAQQEVMAFIEFKRMQEIKPVKGSIPLDTLGDTRPAGVKEMEAQKEKKKSDDT